MLPQMRILGFGEEEAYTHFGNPNQNDAFFHFFLFSTAFGFINTDLEKK